MKASYHNGGRFTSRGEWIHPEIRIGTTELIFVTEGSFRLEEESGGVCKLYELTAGDIIYLDPGKLHRGVGVTDERVSFYWLHFDLGGENPGIKHLRLGDVYPVSLLCRQILHYEERKFGSDTLDSLLAVLMAEIASQDIKREPEDKLAEKVIEWIRINSDRPLTSADISERFGYNEEYISRVLRSGYGHGLKQIISERRMNYLKYLIAETELTMTEIADRGGFTDVKLFTKFFRYHEGVTPTTFRKAYRDGHTNNR